MSYFCPNDISSCPQEIFNYDEIRDILPFDKGKLKSTSLRFNRINMENFFKNSKYESMIDNESNAKYLPYTQTKKTGLMLENGKYLRYERISQFSESHYGLEKFDLEDINYGKTLLRLNRKTGAIYTIRKTHGESGDEYVIRAYLSLIYGEKDYYLDILSQCCIESIPDITFFRDKVKVGTTLDEVKENVRDVKFIQTSANNGYTSFAFADKYGSVLNVYYSKDVDSKFKVTKMNWVCEGANVLPYLLPIDRQLIDPSYVPPEKPGCIIS